MKIQVALLISLLIILAFSQEVQIPSLIISLSRNGPREPVASEIDDSWMSSFELMDIGTEQNFMLGNLLAKKYSYLVQGITPQEVYLQASNHHSTQMSLSAQLLGIFQGRAQDIYGVPMASRLPPFEDADLLNEVSKELQDRPDLIPNRLQLLKPKVLETQDEDLLEVSPANCYAVLQGHQQRYHSEVAAQMMSDFSETIQKLQELGYNITHIRGLAQLGDILESRFLANKTELNGIEFGGTLYNDAVFIYKWWSFYNSVGDDSERSLKVFPLYTRLAEWFTTKATSTNPTKIALLNGHKSLLFSMLSMYNVTNHQCLYENYKNEKAGKPLQYPDCIFPEFGSQLIFEFTRGPYNNAYLGSYIKAFYDGKPVKICKDTPGFECSIIKFAEEKNTRIVQILTKEDLKRVCATPVVPPKPAVQVQSPTVPVDPSAIPVPPVVPTTTSTTEGTQIEKTPEAPVDVNEEEVHDITYAPPPPPSKSEEFVTETTEEEEETLDSTSETPIESKSLVLLKSRIINGLLTALIVLIVILLYIIYLALTHKLVLSKNIVNAEKKDFIPVIEMPHAELEETNESSVNGDSHC